MRIERSKSSGFSLNSIVSLGQMLTIILLTVSAIVNIILAKKINQLNTKIITLKNESGLAEGTLVPSLKAHDLTGRSLAVAFDSTPLPTLIYVFKPSCGWCKKNEENINNVVKQGAGKIQVIGLSLSSEQLPEYLHNWAPKFPIYTNPTEDTISAYRLGGTPSTILVSPDGKLLKVWVGAYTGKTQKQIEDYFKIVLPGVTKQL